MACAKGGQGSLRKCLCCTSVWHEKCLGNTGTEVCPTCFHEQVEAGEESKRWSGYLKTQIDRPRPPAAKTCLQEVIDQDNLQDLGPSHDCHDSWCRGCDQGGDLLCCDHCTLVWHLECVYPAISKVPEGKWACPHCAAKGKPKPKSQGAPQSKPAKRHAKRKSSTNASLLEMVPGGLSFKQQLQLAMSESNKESQQKRRKSQSSPSPAMMPPASNLKSRQPARYMLLGASSMPKKRRLNKSTESQQMSSKFKSDTVQPSNGLDLPRHPQSPSESTALSDTLSQDTVEEDFGLGKFIIHEAAEKVELDGFSICASNEAS